MLFCANHLHSDNTFPISYNLLQSLVGGRLFIVKENGSYLSFFVKPTFGEFSESIFYWKGVKRDSVLGVPSVPPSIVGSSKWFGGLLILSTESNKVFASIIPTSLKVESVVELPNEDGFYTFDKVQFINCDHREKVLILINDYLYLLRMKEGKLQADLISKNVLNACFVEYDNFNIALVKFEEGNGFVYVVDSLGNERIICKIDLSDNISLRQIDDKILIISSSKYYNSSLFQVVSFEQGIVNKFWVETKASNIAIRSNRQHQFIYALRNIGEGYVISIATYEGLRNKVKEEFVSLPRELSEPYGVYYLGDFIYVLFHNGITKLGLDGVIIAKDFLTFGEYFTDNLEIEKVDQYLVLTSRTSSVVLEERKHKLWYLTRFVNNFGNIIIPLTLILILLLILRMYYKQRRLLKALIEVPTTGVVFIVDKYGRLLTANNSGKEMLGITESVPLRRIFSYYCSLEHLKSLNELVEKVISLRESFVQKITFVKNKTDYEWLFTLIPMKSFTGTFKGAVITGIDITEVLGRQKLSNLAQLAHDMQTNLSTIRLNAEQIEVDGSTKNDERRRKIIHQVGLIMQRVRDIVTVGRGEIVRQSVDAFDLCLEARLEFDDIMFPNVEFELDLQHFEINCDKPKMVRAIRNAIENAIKAFQGKPGKITIKNWKDIRNAYFSIKDNGPGMDKSMLEKFMKPYFTTGGTGIGTMIIQHVVELHGGTLKVSSEKGKGTELLFVIPFSGEQRRVKNIKK